MRLSSLNIWTTWRERRTQQKREVGENSRHPKMVWEMWAHSGWGNSIAWTKWETRACHGWTTPLPSKGDELHAKMESGKIGRFRFISVKPCVDPSDMWFGTVEDIGYVEPNDQVEFQEGSE